MHELLILSSHFATLITNGLGRLLSSRSKWKLSIPNDIEQMIWLYVMLIGPKQAVLISYQTNIKTQSTLAFEFKYECIKEGQTSMTLDYHLMTYIPPKFSTKHKITRANNNNAGEA